VIKKFDILALNETRLDSPISDELVGVDGYDLCCADRTRNGGGVCIWGRCNINYQNRPDLVPNYLEAGSLFIISRFFYFKCLQTTKLS
jgi:hypothetical protein